MRLASTSSTATASGYALLLVIAFTGVALLAVAGVMRWSSTSASITERNSQYYRTLAAGEGATEKVLARMTRDFQTNGMQEVEARLAEYGQVLPSAAESALWQRYQLTDPQTGAAAISVARLTPWEFTELRTKYREMRGQASTFRLASQVRELGGKVQVPAVVRQEVQFAAVPLHHFAVFFAVDLEIGLSGTATFQWNGRVHSNSNLYLRASNPLVFGGHVTASQQIRYHSHPFDPVYRVSGPVTFRGEADSRVTTFNLLLGELNTLSAVHEMIEMPPPGEATNTPLGQLRAFNQADLVIRVGDTNILITSGAWNGFSVEVPWNVVDRFVETNKTFFDRRESRQALVTEFDVQKFRSRLQSLQSALGRDPRLVYIADQRTSDLTTMTAVRIVNAKHLPSGGLTVATPNPLYVQGDFNREGGLGVGSQPEPAALICDALTVLSDNWQDAQSTSPMWFRQAASTSLNACVITGIVPSGSGYYSGGLENVFRMLEFWAGYTFTFTGSLAVPFYSEVSTAPWGTWDVYYPPNRVFTFDSSQMQGNRRPAGVPEFRVVFRGAWEVTAAR